MVEGKVEEVESIVQVKRGRWVPLIQAPREVTRSRERVWAGRSSLYTCRRDVWGRVVNWVPVKTKVDTSGVYWVTAAPKERTAWRNAGIFTSKIIQR